MADKYGLPDDLGGDVLGRYSRSAGAGPRESKLRLKLPNLKAGMAQKRGGKWDGMASVSAYRRRVMVKLAYHKHASADAMGKLHGHVTYIQRPGAGEQAVSATLFDGVSDDVKGHSAVSMWRDDRHHFRLIFAPADGAKIGNAEVMRAKLTDPGSITPERVAEIKTAAFRSVVREYVASLESQLGTKLIWFAGVHEKSDAAHKDNRHAHIVIRGMDETGADLVMTRQFIQQGLRKIAEEVVTKRLGTMSASELEAAQRRGQESGRDHAPEQQRTTNRGRGAGL
jgi:type IV secretory pathway VirD2 relaxase